MAQGAEEAGARPARAGRPLAVVDLAQLANRLLQPVSQPFHSRKYKPLFSLVSKEWKMQR